MALLVILLNVSLAFCSSIPVYGTGLNDDFTLATQGTTDIHYSIISSPSSNIATAPYVASSYPPNYFHDRADSQWIGPSAILSPSEDSGNWYFQTTFSLAGLDPSTAALHGIVYADNQVEIYLNGVDTGFGCLKQDGTCFQTTTTYSITSGFVACTNTLTFKVINLGLYIALLASVNGSASPSSDSFPCSSLSCPTQVTGSSNPTSTTASPTSTTGSLNPTQFCVGTNRADWQPYGQGYYCWNSNQFVQCWGDPTVYSAIQSCPAGTSCACAYGVECSDHGSESPCR